MRSRSALGRGQQCQLDPCQLRGRGCRHAARHSRVQPLRSLHRDRGVAKNVGRGKVALDCGLLAQPLDLHLVPRHRCDPKRGGFRAKREIAPTTRGVKLTRPCSHPPRRQLLGLNPGQWHRLDQLFALLSFAALCEHVAQTRRMSPSAAGAATWGLAALVLVLQERGPWSIENTLIPVTASVGLVVWSLIAGPARRVVLGGARQNRAYLVAGVAFALASAIFFVLGLDDRADTYRLLHGAWHVLSGAGSFCLFRAGVTRDGGGGGGDPRASRRRGNSDGDGQDGANKSRARPKHE